MTDMNSKLVLQIVGDASLQLEIKDGHLHSIGAVTVKGVALRNPSNSFLPWFDTYEGDVFRKFRFVGVEQCGKQTVISTRAVSDPDVLFQERRDSSGDICLRPRVWGAPALEADFRIVLEPVTQSIDGRAFTGFKYWFEYESDKIAIHRIVDRQTWEIGGDLSEVNVVCRNLFDLPREKITRESSYSSVGLDNWAGLLPGNLWARWSLLPAFDMQYGEAGVIVGWFDKVSCIRSVIESMPDEDWVRYVDIHYFEKSIKVMTNPKTILYSSEKMDDTDALNLWTRLQDQEHDKACAQFGIRDEEPPAIVLSKNVWTDFEFDTTYNDVLDIAAEFGADYIFIDACWQNMETYQRTLRQMVGDEKIKESVLDKLYSGNMCCSLDFEVSEIAGGESGLKRLCDSAQAKGVKVISWMATHYFGASMMISDTQKLGHGTNGVLAAKESGLHPDTGYPTDCQTINLNAPIYEKIRGQFMGVCKRTGLSGYLWDSFSNLGWWQVDYSDGTMRPQFDRMAQLYADLTNEGLYIQPEAVVGFSNHSCCSMHGGNIYGGDLLGYSYNTGISLSYNDDSGQLVDQTAEILRGRQPIDELFQCFAHKRIVGITWSVPRSEWNPESIQQIKELFASYKANRLLMQKRTVLKDGAGVLWENKEGKTVLFSFRDQVLNGRQVSANKVYQYKK